MFKLKNIIILIFIMLKTIFVLYSLKFPTEEIPNYFEGVNFDDNTKKDIKEVVSQLFGEDLSNIKLTYPENGKKNENNNTENNSNNNSNYNNSYINNSNNQSSEQEEKRKAAEAYERFVQEKESEVTKAIKNKEYLLEELERRETELNNSKSIITKIKNKKMVNGLKRQIEKKQEIIEKKSKDVKRLWNTLGDIYSEIEKTGDPVDVSTGNFIAEYTDYKAQDYNEYFTVKRSLTDGNIIGSLGNNWICSLDERIIRCNYSDNSEYINLLKDKIKILKEIQDEYTEFYNNYKRTNEEIKSVYEKSFENEKIYREELEYFENCQKIRYGIIEKNKYVTYGKFANEDNYYGYEDMLIYIDESGNEYLFEYKSDNKWEVVNDSLKHHIILKGLDVNGNYCNDLYCDGGYEITLESGYKKIFSKFGILTKEIDNNKNETSYIERNGTIEEIKLKTGEIININRNDKNYITSISGPVSGNSSYLYNGDDLINVTNNEGITNKYSYLESGELSKIIKADDSFISIEYEYNSLLKRLVCVKVINENGYEENFKLDLKNRTMNHYYYGEAIETYNFDEKGRTDYYVDIYKNKTKINRDSEGKLASVNTNNNVESYIYNKNNQVIEINYGNNTKKEYFYNKNGNISKIINQDGINNIYEYDECGNIIRIIQNGKVLKEYNYYTNGLLKNYRDEDIVYLFKYNNFGSITEKKTILKDGRELINTWKYNGKNQPVEIRNYDGKITHFDYEVNTDIIKTDNYVRKRTFNNRGWVVRDETEDKITGTKYIKRNEYDRTGNITKVFINDKLFTEYEYYKIGLLKSFTVWNMPDNNNSDLLESIRTDYIYNENWQISKVVKSRYKKNKVFESINAKEYKYSKQNNKIIVQLKEYAKPKINFIYDNYGNLIKKEFENGFYELFKYSATGKLIEQRDSQNNSSKILYYDDGSYKIIYQNSLGGQISYLYNKNNMITKLKDYYGLQYTFEYDSINQLITEKGPDYCIKREYDLSGRIISYNLYDKYGELQNNYSYEYNDQLNEKRTFLDNRLNSIIKYDIWGRVVESNNINGHYFYEFDSLGNCTKITDYYGNSYICEYSPLKKLIQKKFPNGTVENYDYNLQGTMLYAGYGEKNPYFNIQKDRYIEINNKGTRNYIKYDDDSLVEINNYDTGKLIRKKIDNSNYNTYDDYGNIYKYNFNSNGQIITETNPNGLQLNFEYDNAGELIKRISYSGNIQEYANDRENRKTTIKYDTGEKIEITRNLLGQTIELENKGYKLSYKYDNCGNLISEYSNLSDTLVEYEYDDFCRCVSKHGKDFHFKYDYDEMSRLVKAEDKKTGNYVKFNYDKMGRVIKKAFSNGTEENYSYNSKNQLEYLITKNNFDLVIFSNYILYDKFGRISAVSDKDGCITKYKYDDTGRLISTEYPFTEDRKEFYKEEAFSCGFYQTDLSPNCAALSLTQEDITSIRKLYEKSGVSGFVDINFNQKSWKEEYSYDKNGNINSIKNPYGEIIYEHDNLNRIISKNYSNTKSFGIKIKWNEENCIETIKNKNKEIYFIYGKNNRPVIIKSLDINTGNITETKYLYDGFGRRVLESFNDISIEYIYDGFSVNLLSKQVLINGKYTNTVLSNIDNENNISEFYKTGYVSKYKPEEDYKYINNKDYTPNYLSKTYSKSIDKKTVEQKLKEIRSYTVLSFANIPLIISYIDGTFDNNCENEFIITNYNNDYVATVNLESNLTNIVYSETWGSFNSDENKIDCWGNKNSDNQFDYIINLGYRDYIPLLKSFTTEDPVRDGKNWFAYCCGDPINYKDLSGLAKKSLSKSEQCYFRAEMMNYCNFNEEEYHKANARGENYLGLHSSYDCADTSLAINVFVSNKIGVELNSQVAKDFDEAQNNKLYNDAKSKISSASMINSPEIRKVVNGADYEYIKYANQVDNFGNKINEYDETIYKNEQENINKFEEALSNPENICPGTVIAMKNSVVKREDTPELCGHTITVVSVEYNEEKTKVIGFAYLEGHTGGNRTELNYVSVIPNGRDCSISSFFGANAGVYEIENAATEEKKSCCTD